MVVEVHSRWGVALHTDDIKAHDASTSSSSSPSSASSELQAVKEQGEALCSRLMPKVPVPKPFQDPSAAGAGAGSARGSLPFSSPLIPAWTPPQGQRTLAYLFELLNMVTGLLSVLETAKIDLPHLLPTDALMSALHQVNMCKKLRLIATSFPLLIFVLNSCALRLMSRTHFPSFLFVYALLLAITMAQHHYHYQHQS